MRTHLTTCRRDRGVSVRLPVVSKVAGITDDKTAAAALGALPADVRIKGAPSRVDGGGPIIDGRLLIEDPEHSFAKSHQAKVTFLIGGNLLDCPFAPGANKNFDAPSAKVAANRDAAITVYGEEGSTRITSPPMFVH